MENNIVSNHTGKTLGKYIGMTVCFYEDEDLIFGELNRINVLSEEQLIYVPDRHLGYGCYGPSIYNVNIFPVLKTIYDLKDYERQELGLAAGYDDFKSDVEDVDHCYSCTKGSQELLLHDVVSKALELEAGSIPDKSSPTGYISVHDGLPCFKFKEE